MVVLSWLSGATASADGRWRALSQPVFQALGGESGFPKPLSAAIAQDREGFIWIGSSAGLSRWDGYRLRIFTAAGPSPALPDAFIQAIHLDPAGRLWIGTAAGGAVRYDPEYDRFVAVRFEDIADQRVEIRDFADDGADGLWIATARGIYHLVKAGSPARLLVPSASWGHGLALLRDRSGTVWVGAQHGLFAIDRHGVTRAVPLPMPAIATRVLAGDRAVISLAQDKLGRIWAGTFNSGAFVVDAAGGTVRQLTAAAPQALQSGAQSGARAGPQSDPALATLDVEHIIEARPGEIWLATSGQGIVTVDEATGEIGHIRHDPLQPASLAGDVIADFFRDQAGAIWIATDHGINLLADPSGTFKTVFSAPGLAGRISDPNVTAILPASDGQTWLGLEGGGIDRIDADTGSITSLAASSALPQTTLDHLLEIPGQGVFIATWQGLFHADLAGARITPVETRSPGTDAVTDLATLGDTLLVPQAGELHGLRPGSGEPAHPMLSLRLLSDPRVLTMLPDGGKKLWVGTWDGLNLVDLANGQVEQIHADPNRFNGLSANLVTCLVKDRHGRLWVGTSGGGIDILTGRDAARHPIFRHLGMEDGLPDLSIDAMLLAGNGALWASTDDGLVKIDPDTLAIRSFHLAEGVAIFGYWREAAAITKAGELLFGGAGGMTVVAPDRLQPPPPQPRLVVTDVLIGGHSVANAQLNLPGPAALVRVAPSAGAFTVEFSALDYANPDRSQYAYRLLGLDTGWTLTDATRRVATYTNLPPRKYVLELRAFGANGTQASRAIAVEIQPAWYQTIAATIALALLGMLLIGGLMWLSTLLMRRRQHELEQLVARRTGELSRSNDALSNAVDSLSQLGRLGREITASLDNDVVLAVLHRSVVSLTEAHAFSVYLVNLQHGSAEWRFGMLNGRRLEREAAPPSEAAIVASAIAQRSEIVQADPARPHPGLVCMPLIVQERVIGAIVIAARHDATFRDPERMIFRTLCSYGAIALSNAETLLRLADMHGRLERIAYSDSLTDLPNRRAFNERLDEFIARTTGQSGSFALLLIDLDDFKNINDTYGHDIGDAILIEAARRLRLIICEKDEVQRLGGDEFAVLLDAHSAASLHEISRRIVTELAAGIDLDGRLIVIDASIGVALFPADATTPERLYKAADIALYAAKHQGGSTTMFFEPALGAAELSARQLKQDLADAIRTDGLAIFYQPIFSVGDRSLRSFEALLRWHHPSRGWLGPNDFIAIAEESGLISAVGRIVLADAIATLARLQRAAIPCRICVNLSVHHLSEGMLYEFLTQQMHQANVSPPMLTIEVTESTLMNETAMAEIQRLKSLGVSISIDDFGTGYSSLAYLSALPVDSVKIDQRFVSALGGDPKAARFFRAIVDLAHTLELRTIAEGCETEDQFAIIKASGCDDVQGWLFSPALDPDSLGVFLAQNEESGDHHAVVVF